MQIYKKISKYANKYTKLLKNDSFFLTKGNFVSY